MPVTTAEGKKVATVTVENGTKHLNGLGDNYSGFPSG